MYQLQYWNEREAQWKSAGITTSNYELIMKRQFQMIEDCGGCVRFRILLPSCAAR